MKLDAKIPSGPIAEKWDKHRFEMKLVNPANKRKFSAIIVGSGLAGASAAAQSAGRRGESGGASADDRDLWRAALAGGGRAADLSRRGREGA